MAWVAAFAVTILLSTSGFAADADKLIGTWRLVSYTSKLADTGQTEQALGKAPHGFITYSRDGRMMVIITADKRPKPGDVDKITDEQRADLFRTMISYAGTYTFNGEAVTHHLDISWNEVWTGTNQVRHAKFDGDRLTLTTNPIKRSTDGKMAVGVLVWEKMK